MHQHGYSAICMKNKKGTIAKIVCFSAKRPFSSSVDPLENDLGAAGISMVTARRRLPQGAQAAPATAAWLGSGSQAGAVGRTQKDGVTFGNGLPCRTPSGPALGRDTVSAPGKAQRKLRCARAEVALVPALHRSVVMGNAPNAVLPHSDPWPRPLWYALVR